MPIHIISPTICRMPIILSTFTYSIYKIHTIYDKNVTIKKHTLGLRFKVLLKWFISQCIKTIWCSILKLVFDIYIIFKNVHICNDILNVFHHVVPTFKAVRLPQTLQNKNYINLFFLK